MTAQWSRRRPASRAWSMPSSAGGSSPYPAGRDGDAADADLEHYGYRLELVVENGVETILGHGGADPGGQ
jgi:hypothetical protein